MSLTTVAILMVVVLLAGEGYVRLIAAHLPAPTDTEAELTLKYAQVREAAGRPVRGADVVYMGNSMTDAAVRPDLVSAARPGLGSGYNAAVLGMPVPQQARWLREFVLPAQRPRLVVLGVSPLDLLDTPVFDDPQEFVQRKFDHSLDALRPSVLERIDDRLSHLSYLVRYRIAFRNPSMLARATGRRLTGGDVKNDRAVFQQATLADGRQVRRDAAFWRETLAADGAIGNYRALTFDPGSVRLFTPAERHHLASGQLQLDWLRRLVAAARSTGAKVVAFVPPLEPIVAGEPGPDPTAYRHAVALLRTGLARLHVPAVDVGSIGLGPGSFADTAHLNDEGSAAFSRALAAAIRVPR